MPDLIWRATLKGAPRTKKNHQQILKNRSGRPFVAPSKEFLVYQEQCLWQIRTPQRSISEAANVKAVYYMPDRRRDRDNIAAGRKFVQDALVRCKVLQNDGWKEIIGFSDDWAVDKARPRVEIEIVETKV